MNIDVVLIFLSTVFFQAQLVLGIILILLPETVYLLGPLSNIYFLLLGLKVVKYLTFMILLA